MHFPEDSLHPENAQVVDAVRYEDYDMSSTRAVEQIEGRVQMIIDDRTPARRRLPESNFSDSDTRKVDHPTRSV